MEPGELTVRAFDHLVLRCADVEATLAWYVGRLGLQPVRVEQWRAGEAPFPSVRVDEGCIIDLIGGGGEQPAGVPDRLDHLCLVVDPTDLDAVAASGRFEVVDGPAPRFGARGTGNSLYVKDPDGVTVELRWYP